MKKRILVISTLAISFLMATSVFAAENTNYNYNCDYANARFSDEDYSAMQQFMEEKYGYSMMDRFSSENRVNQENSNDDFGYSANNGNYSGRSCH